MCVRATDSGSITLFSTPHYYKLALLPSTCCSQSCCKISCLSVILQKCKIQSCLDCCGTGHHEPAPAVCCQRRWGTGTMNPHNILPIVLLLQFHNLISTPLLTSVCQMQLFAYPFHLNIIFLLEINSLSVESYSTPNEGSEQYSTLSLM